MNNLLFALDIGTRSVVGLVGEKTPNGIRLIASEREEHRTRSMLDGQIHDVPEVAAVLANVKTALEQKCGPLRQVSIAAAGRALCTIKAAALLDTASRGALTRDDEAALELAAIQSAQQQLASSGAAQDPTGYYCVGYSVVGFSLDDAPIKTLVGQRGKTAGIEIIATFLPRPVIDSLQSAVEKAGLEIATLTLEPIAAINALIPATMRHLNLALVDVGAGTSDVAVTKNGSVIGYGMVPFAGDEITEAISQRHLLDFNVAETLKRQLGSKAKKLCFQDVLGIVHKVTPQEIITAITPNVADLAGAIAMQIIALNGGPPQAVLLVGGGSLTPLLPELLAQTLDLPPSRVAVRRPDTIEGITGIPASLSAPDAVTPLGILKLAGSSSLTFIQAVVNERALRLFNLGKLTVADALLAAGIDVRSLHGRPGLGITVTINGHKKFIAGTHGRPGTILLNDCPAKLTDPLHDGDIIRVTKGIDGLAPCPALREVVELPQAIIVSINGKNAVIAPIITVNGTPAATETLLQDRDQIVCRLPETLGEVLTAAGCKDEPVTLSYIVNGSERSYTVWPQYLVNGKAATAKSPVAANDSIAFAPGIFPTAGEIVGFAEQPAEVIKVDFNGTTCTVPVCRLALTVNGQPAALSDTVLNGGVIEYNLYKIQPTVSDTLLAADFDPRALPPGSRVDILLNGVAAEYTSPVKNGDRLKLVISKS
ncbi:MAG: rod shape-determining protein [Negativicutes bacterium]|nr:rod shape-determining protein [Negativicutes bacterium]